jgi:hypothetical protein
MNMTPTHRISAVLVVGRQRSRAQAVLDGISAQSCAGLEAIVIDLYPDMPALKARDDLDLSYITTPVADGFQGARALGVRLARAPYVAFLEDHCTPQAGWAEAVVQAFDSGPWAAVGYAFINANPETYVSRGCMMADYGLWAVPHPDRQVRLLPGNNVAYRREILMGYGERMTYLLSPDFVMHERLRLDGHRLFLAGSAVAAHQNPTDIRFLLTANHAYCRLLASQRVRSRSWGLGRRWLYALAVPVGAPLIKMARAARILARRPRVLMQFIAALPVVIPAFVWSAIGESLGYAVGVGGAKDEFEEYELNRSRV